MTVNKIKRNGSYAPLSAHYYKDDAIDEAGLDAELLYVRGLAFCADMLSDGFISDRQLVRFVGVGMPDVSARAACLVDVELWEREAGGYRVRSWLEWNRSRDEIKDYQTADAARKRKPAEAPPTPPEAAPRRRKTPARPAAEETPEPAPDESAGTGPIPDDWAPHDIHRMLAKQRGVDVEHEATQFRAHAAGTGRTFRNVNEAFRYWLGNAKPPRGGALRPPPSPDRALTNDEVDDILGPETGPLAPPDVENGDPEARKEWYRRETRVWRDQRRETAQAKLQRRAAQ